MTDVANAVFDGADATMLSGETANGAFPDKAVETMAAIVKNAELGIDYWAQYNFLSRMNAGAGRISSLEASIASVAKTSVEYSADANGDGVISAEEGTDIIVITEDGVASDLLSKYRPPCPIFVVTNNPYVAHRTQTRWSQFACLVEGELTLEVAAKAASDVAHARYIPFDDRRILMVTSPEHGPVKTHAISHTVTIHEGIASNSKTDPLPTSYVDPGNLHMTISQRASDISLDQILKPNKGYRKTNIVCTMGPKCWSLDGMRELLRAGMGVARFNFSHGDHAAHQEVLDRFHEACALEGAAMKERLHIDFTPNWACLLDTKGPEIRTAMLKDHEPIVLEAGQPITVEAVGDKYTEFEGYKTDEETRIGLSYARLCQSVHAGNTILIADGSISIRVDSIESDTVLKGTVMNTKKLGERKNCNLPGVKVDIPVLTAKDIDDVQNFCCKNKMDYIAASFVQTGEDVQLIRKTLDDAGGQHVRIICKIENEEGLANIDDILTYTDGIMVARGDLGMEIPSEKVALAQKMLITKANVAGRFVICATQMLESMCTNPLPTRAEMTDVANAVFDGADATMLSGETANGAFPDKAVETMAAITANAELAKTTRATVSFLRDFTKRPFTTMESAASDASAGAIDARAELIIVVSAGGVASRAISKYQPPVPVLVVTADAAVARQTGAKYAQYPMLVEDLSAEQWTAGRDSIAAKKAREMGLMSGKWNLEEGTGNIVVVCGPDGGDADETPVVHFY
jgi:pyruvate kinase